jgi:hypothetical protein
MKNNGIRKSKPESGIDAGILYESQFDINEQDLKENLREKDFLLSFRFGKSVSYLFCSAQFFLL